MTAARVLAVSVLACASPSAVRAVPDPAPACQLREFEGSGFTVCLYDPAQDELRIALDGKHGPLGGFRALKKDLGDDAQRLAFAINGGMFQPGQSPVGLLVQDGRTVHPVDAGSGKGNFYLLPNGVFLVGADGSAHVMETRTYAASAAAPAWATQSGPLLVQRGEIHPAITPNGSSQFTRNGVCVDGSGRAWFAISDEPVSFGRLARLFRDELHCPEALYLDGSVSALWAPELKRRDARTGLGPLVVVLRKMPAS